MMAKELLMVDKTNNTHDALSDIAQPSPPPKHTCKTQGGPNSIKLAAWMHAWRASLHCSHQHHPRHRHPLLLLLLLLPRRPS
jgi:hypothetical protein